MEAVEDPKKYKALMCVRCKSNFKTNHNVIDKDLCLGCTLQLAQNISSNIPDDDAMFQMAMETVEKK